MRMKKLNALLLAAVIGLMMLVPALAEETAQAIDLSGHIVILHTNDSHGRADTNLGFSRAAYAKDKLESAGATVLLIDAGDALHGLPFANVSEGESIVKLMNEAGYDAMTVGSHDFVYGQERILELADLSEFELLAANVLQADGSALLPGRAIIGKNHVKFGLFGLTAPEAAGQTSRNNGSGLTLADPIETAKEQVAALEAENCTLIIALTHLGMEKNGGVTAEMLAGQVPGIDVIVDGGSHTLLEEGMWVGNTLIVSAGEHLENIGCVDIDPTGLTAATMLTDEDLGTSEGDAAVNRLMAEITAAQDELLKVRVGDTAVELNGGEAAVRTGETNFGNLAADALRSAAGSEIALISGGSICESIPAGEITKGQLAAAFPLGNYAVLTEITGAQLLAALENGVSLYPAAEGRFPQISGMTFRFDPAQPAGSRVFDVKVNGEALDAARIYTLSTIDFIADGGDGYPQADASVSGGFGTLEEILTGYIESFGAPIEPGVEGRIVMEARPAD